jgi:hypothetical protein
MVVSDELVHQLDTIFAPEFPTIQYLNGRTLGRSKGPLWLTLKQITNHVYEENLLNSMDCEYLEEKIMSFNKAPLLINTNRLPDMQDKYYQYGRQTFANEPITLRILMQNVMKIPTTIAGLIVDYDFYTLDEPKEQSFDLL